MTADAITVSGLGVLRGHRCVLHELSFTIPRGTVTGLLGPSGSGKTTLLRCLVGVQAVTTGTVTVLGHPAGAAALRGTVGYATQSPAVYPDLTVTENLRFFASVLGISRTHVDRVVADVGLGGNRHRRVGRLSGGERARTSLAVALLGEPELLVLDEPTVGLDPVLRDELWSLFHRLAAGGVTLLVSSHVMDEAARCERLLLLRGGRLLADGTPTELLRRTGQADLDAAFLDLVRQERETAG
ncbi:ABC transporter ATP-binding protein [Actinophytocola sediminis]